MKSFFAKALVIGSIMGLSTAAFAAADFSAADADGNGEVTVEEFMAANPDMTEEQFTALDQDGNGMLSEEEYSAQQ